MVDLSHSGEQTCLDAARASRQPISINHTGCRALADLPRNKTDEELRLVAEKGGFVGIYFMPFLNRPASCTRRRRRRPYRACGERLRRGSCRHRHRRRHHRHRRHGRPIARRIAKEVAERRAAGIGAAGEKPDTYPFVDDLRGPDQFRKLIALLGARGYPRARGSRRSWASTSSATPARSGGLRRR